MNMTRTRTLTVLVMVLVVSSPLMGVVMGQDGGELYRDDWYITINETQDYKESFAAENVTVGNVYTRNGRLFFNLTGTGSERVTRVDLRNDSKLYVYDYLDDAGDVSDRTQLGIDGYGDVSAGYQTYWYYDNADNFDTYYLFVGNQTQIGVETVESGSYSAESSDTVAVRLVFSDASQLLLVWDSGAWRVDRYIPPHSAPTTSGGGGTGTTPWFATSNIPLWVWFVLLVIISSEFVRRSS